ncbi:MAG: branched-chain amino acid ABC transporter permease [Hyphomicrobiaceae bacterium]
MSASALLRAAHIVPAALLVASCSGGIDGGHLRICRMVLPALNPTAGTLEILHADRLRQDEGVRLRYRVQAQGETARVGTLVCRFTAASHAAVVGSELRAVETEKGSLSPVRLHILKRWWLERPESAASDPAPVTNSVGAPIVPLALALGIQHLVSALPLVSIYGLLAAAYSLLYGLAGRINLAFGELLAVAGYAAFLGFAFGAAGLPLAVLMTLALLLSLFAAAVYGTALGCAVVAPLLRAGGQQALIGTIALAIVLQEYLRLAQGSKSLWLQPVLSEPHALVRAGHFIATVTPIAAVASALALLAAGALLALLRWSHFGRCWRASADDPHAAALFGVDPSRTLTITFALSSALAGLAGYIVTLYYGSVGYTGGMAIGLKALTAAIAGGIGSVPGAFIGGVLLGSAEALWSAMLPLEYRDPAILALLVVVLVLRPGGLLGFGDLLPRRV